MSLQQQKEELKRKMMAMPAKKQKPPPKLKKDTPYNEKLHSNETEEEKADRAARR